MSRTLDELEHEMVERAATILMAQVDSGKMTMVPYSTEAARFCVRPIVADAITQVAAHIHFADQAVRKGAPDA